MEDRILHSADLSPLGLTLAPVSAVLEQRIDESAALAPATSHLELAFIDARTPAAAAGQLNAGWTHGPAAIEPIIIASEADGLARIGAELGGRTGAPLAGLHLVLAEAVDGTPLLGSSRLDAAELLTRAGDVAGWGDALGTAASITLHGGGAGAAGFGRQIGELTGATVHAAPLPVVPSGVDERRQAAAAATELVFVDAAVPDAEALIADLLAQRDAGRPIEVLRIAAGADGIAVIGGSLAGRSEIVAVHVISHGSAGALQLGGSRLDAAALVLRSAEIAAWAPALSADADLLFYGCDVAADATGRALLERLAALTGADVAASIDPTGAAASGGDWELEYHAGTIDSSVAFSATARQEWGGLLATYAADPGKADGAVGSLRWAIAQANATVGVADTVVLLQGTHRLTLLGVDDSNALGDLDITDSVTLVGSDANNTFIDASALGANRALHLLGGTVTLQNLTIQGGGAGGIATGGGVQVEAAARATLTDVVLKDNKAADGAAIWNAGTLTLNRVTLRANVATNAGGGLRTTGAASLTDVAFDANSAKLGGAIHHSLSTSLALQRVTFSANSATQSGGALYTLDAGFSASNVTFSGNSAGNNPTSNNGGAIYSDNGGGTVASATIAGNSGGGLFSRNGAASKLTLVNTILADNTGGNSNLAQVSAGWNLDTDGSAGLNLATDRKLVPAGLGQLGQQGGYTRTIALLPGSAAIDAGDPSAPALDQRGVARSGTPDIGASEFVTAPVLTLPGSALLVQDTSIGFDAAGYPIAISDDNAGTAPGRLDLAVTNGLLTLPLTIGPEYAVNTTTANTQQNPRIAVAADGHYVVVWHSDRQDGSKLGVFARIFNADGSARSGEIQVNTTTTDDQRDPAVAIDASGRFVVAWQSYDAGKLTHDIYARSFAADGSALSAQKRITTDAGEQTAAAVAVDATGNVVIAYTSKGQDAANSEGIYARRANISLATLESENRVNTVTSGAQMAASVAASDAGYVIVWQSAGQDGSGIGIYGQRYTTTGSAIGTEFRINATTAGDQSTPSVAATADGRFVVAWQSKDQDGSGWGIFARRYDAAGTAIGGEWRVNTTTASDQTAPSVAITNDGRFTIGWVGKNQDHPDGREGVYAQGYAADGSALLSEFRVNSTTIEIQSALSLGMAGDGTIEAVWQSDKQDGANYGIFGQRLLARDAISLPGGSQSQPSLSLIGSVADLNAALATLRYMPDAGFWGPVTLSVSFSDLGNDALPVEQASGTVPIRVQKINQPPVNQVPGPQVADEDVPIVFSSANGNAITIADVDADPYDMQVTLSALQGNLRLARTDGLTFVSGADNSKSMVLQGTLAALNAALDGLSYTGATHYFGLDTLSLKTSDLGRWEVGGVYEVSSTVGITLNSINDVPQIVRPAAPSTAEGTVLLFSAGDLLRIDDPDAFGGNLEISLSAVNGDLKLAGVRNLSFTVGTGRGGETRMTFTGKLIDINVALNGLEFEPTNGYAGPAYLGMTVSDLGNTGLGGALTARELIEIAVVPDATNARPVISTPANQVTTEETPLVLSSSSGNALQVLDDAGGLPVSVTLSVDSGTLTLGTATGSEFQVNATVAGDQSRPRVAAAPDGSHVVVWQGPDGGANGGTGIRMQRYSDDGFEIGSETRVNTTVIDNQTEPAVAMGADGSFVVVWTSDGQEGGGGIGTGIYGQRFAADGAAIGAEFHVNTTIVGDQTAAAVDIDASGRFVIVWQSQGQDGDNGGIYAQRFAADGSAIGSEFRVNTVTAKEQQQPVVAMGVGGSFVVAWQGQESGNQWGVFAQRYDAAGVPAGGEFRVSTISFKDQLAPAIASDDAGNFVVVWQSKDVDYNDGKYGIYGQRYAANGSAVGSQFLVNTTTPNEQTQPAVAMDGSGAFVVAWQGLRNGLTGLKHDIFAQRFDAAGQRIGTEFMLNSTVADEQIDVSVATSDQGQLIAVWKSADQDGSSGGIFGQRHLDARRLSFSTGDGIDDASMTFTGTLAQVNDVLDGLIYRPATDFADRATLSITVNDLGNSGSGGAKSSSSSFSIDVLPVNDAPTVALPAPPTFVEDDPMVFSVATGRAIVVSDVDAGTQKLLMTISAPVGTLSLASTGGLTFSIGDGVSDASMTFTGTRINLNKALDGLQLLLPQGYTGSGSIDIMVNDQGNVGSGGALFTHVSLPLTVVPGPTNEAPRVIEPAPQRTAIGAPLVFSAALQRAIGIVDDAGSGLVRTTVTVTNGTATLSAALGGEQTVNRLVTLGAQSDPQIAVQPDGSHVIVWASDASDGSGSGVWGQRFSAGGARLGPEFRVNTTTVDDQFAPALAANAGGGFVVAWVSDNQDGEGMGVYVQRFDAAGNRLGGEVLANTTIGGDQIAPAVAMAADGSFVVAWQSADADGQGIYAQRFDAGGEFAGGEFLVNLTTQGAQLLPAVATDAAGNFTIVWQGQDADKEGIIARRFDAAGNPLSGEMLINATATLGSQITPTIAINDAGSAVIAWQHGAGGGSGEIVAQRLDASGALVGPAFLVNTTTTGTQSAPVAAINAGGQFVIAWQSLDADKSGVYGQVYAADGSVIGREQLVNTTTTGDQLAPSIGMLADGSYHVSWSGALQDGNGTGIASQRMLRGNELTFNVGTGVAESSFTFTGTLADVNAALDGLRFVPTPLFSGVANVRLDVNDLGSSGSGGAKLDSGSVDIVVGNGPLLDLDADNSGGGSGADFRASFRTGLGPVAVADVDATVSDPNTANLPSMTVRITNAFDGAAESLSVVTGGTTIIASYNSATATLTLGGANSVANYQKVLRTLKYDNLAATPNTTTRVITVVTTDGTTASNIGTTLVSFPGAVDTPPTAIDDSHSMLDSEVLVVVPGGVLGNDIDPDGDTMSAQLISGPSNGTLLSFDADGGFSYQPLAGFHGTDTFTYQAQANGLFSGTATVSIVVARVNDAPVGADATLALLEDQPRVLQVADFGFSDPADAPADSLLGVLVETAPAAGSLTLDGTAVAAGQFVSAADIAAGKLQFAPAPDAAGAGYAQIGFRVRDDGGTDNGGADTDATLRTLSFDVTPVNDAPRGSDATLQLDIDEARVLARGDFGFVDAAGEAHAFASVLLQLPSAGTLRLSGSVLTVATEVSVAQLDAGALVYTPAPGGTGAAYASLGFQVRDDGGLADGGTDLDPQQRTLGFDVFDRRPVITSNGGGATAAISMPENSSVVTTVTATDVDGGPLLYSITGGADAARFTIDAGGVLSFVTPPNYEAPTDVGADNGYQVIVSVTDPTARTDQQTISITVTDVTSVAGSPSGVLWFATESSGSANGVSWSDREVLQFGSTDDRFEINGANTTAGTIAKLPGFVAPDEMRSLHRVQTTLTLGAGGSATQFTLNPGDLLVVFDHDDVDLNVGDGNPYNNFDADRRDIVVFRPTVAGNYASGSWYMLAENAVHDGGGAKDIRALALVETDTVVGGKTLTAGTLLVSHQGGAEDSNIYTVQVDSTGFNSTVQTAPRQLLLRGPSIGLDAKIEGVHLLTQATAFNDTLLPAGTLLLAIDGADTVGGVAMTNMDIVALTVSKTEQDAAPATAATGVLLFDGSDIGLTVASPKDIRGMTVASGPAPTNTPPTIVTMPLPVISENTTFVTTLAASDPEGGPISYSIVGSSDRAFFTVAAGNELRFISAPDFENRLDADADNDYWVQVRATDASGAASEQVFVVRVANVNEAPVAASDQYAEQEDATLNVSSGAGVLANDSDIDAGDSRSVSAVAHGASSGTVGQWLVGTYGSLRLQSNGSFSYQPSTAAAQALAAGETAVDIFNYTVRDAGGLVDTTTIRFTVTGTNDAVAITSADLAAAVTELTGTPSGNLVDSGTIDFSDLDLSDVHAVSATGTPVGSGVLGSLTAVKDSDTTGSGTGGRVTWTYAIAASNVEYLAAGQTRSESFDLTLSDGKGSTVVQRVVATVTGSNDAIVVTAEDLVGAISEPVAPIGNLGDSGSISFSDVDLSDVHTVSASGTPIGSVLGSLTAVKNTDTTGTGTGGRVTWNYSVAASKVEYLAAGETLTESFTISLSDGKGSTIVKRIDVTITGSNDVPVIVAEDLVGAISEPVTPVGNLTDTGSISFSDRDLSDVHVVSAVGTPIGSVLGSLSAVKLSDTTGSGTGGQLSWTYSVAASAVEYLAAGETRVESFTITLDDGNGGLLVKRIDVTISGSNDAIVVTGEDLVGAITEPVTPVGDLSDTGSISFSDVDLSDVHTVSATGTPIGSVLGSLSAVKLGDTTGSGTGGALSWTYRVAASAVEYLAAGETLVESFTIALSDGKGSTLVRRIDVTISGSNDAIVVTGEDLAGAITEPVTPVGTLTDSGSISFSDRDLSDEHIVSPNGAPIGSVLGSLMAVKTADTTGTGTGGRLNWNYSVAASAVEYLAAGETLVESFTITLDDGNGSTIVRQIDVTITGSNDLPVIVAEDLVGAVTEPVTPSGNLSDSGTISFSDVDLSDGHVVSASGTPIGSVLGSLSAVKDSDTTGSGTGGQLSWNYSVAASAVEYLAAGETKTDSFTITLDDGNGGVLVKRIDVTISGSNDAIIITGEDLVGAITEPVTPVGSLSDTGSISFSDVDLSDVHAVSAVGTPIGSVLGSLSAVKTSDTTGSGTGGALSWTYSVTASAVEYLAAGETLVERFEITLTDSKGSTITKQIEVTISGSNDIPVIVAEDLVGSIIEPITPSGTLTDSGTISFSDRDLSDVHAVPAVGTPVGSVLGSLSAVKLSDTTGSGTGGALSWTYSVAASAVEYLAAGETLVESFTITLDDGNGGVLAKRIDVTISGSNDAIIITGEDLVGAITEPVTPVGNLSDTGSISFSDVDLGDVHTVSPVGTPIGSVLGSLSAVKTSDTTGSGTGGALSWTYRVAASAVEYLAAGETLVESFTIALSDGQGSTVAKRIDVTISGSNDAIVVTSEDLVGAITEPVTPVGDLSDSGTVSFSDRDLSDVHVHSAIGTPVGSVLGSLSVIKDSDTTGSGTGGQLSWNYRVAASAVEYLAAGETRVESFTITLDDGNGSLISRQIDVTITGGNDVPVIVAEDLLGAITEPVTPSGNLTDTGSITFSDRDLSDVHTVSATGTPIGSVLGTLSAVKDSDTTGSGIGGQLSWTYSVAASAVEYLAGGETKTDSFTITLDDGNGGLLVKRIDVTISGSNDAIIITGEDLVGAIAEPVTPSGSLTDSGSITFSDVDLSDVHTVSAVGTPIGSVLGSLSAVKDSDTTGSGIGGRLSWTYSVAASAVEYLAAGETLVERFEITLTDSKGSLVSKQIEVTISGSNDVPVIVAEDLVGAIIEPVTPSGILTDTGSIRFSDRDLSDVHTVSASGTPIGAVLGTLSAVKDSDTTGSGTGGQLSWTYNVAASAVEYLAAGETLVESFTITLDDGNGGLLVKRIDVTISGSNDAIIITGEDLVGAITEPVTPVGSLSDSGSISFSDVDLSDVHTVSATGTPIGSVLGSLSAVKDSDTTGSGIGGRLSWTYSVAASAVEYLAAGETLVERFEITLTDSRGSLVTKQIEVTISGSNDAIVVTSEDLVGAITEPVTPVGNLIDTGSITFSDRDLSDVHTVSAIGTPIGVVLGSLSAVKDSDTSGAGTGGQLSWTYSVAASAVEYLAAGETLVESFTITLDDGNGGLLVKQIEVTISGSNDIPVIVAEDLVGAITEPVMPVGTLTDSGTIRFSDVDLSDVHTVSASGAPIGAVLGALSAVKDSDTTGAGTGGRLSWTYSVAASAVEYLAAGETLVESFTITLDDGNGGVLVKRIDVTISGSNDAIVVTSEDLVGALAEPVTPFGDLSDSGTISFSDRDLSDVHTVSATGTPIGSVLGSLSVVKDSDTTGSGTGGQLSWNYRVAASAVEYLAAGETRVESFTITLDDGHGSTIVRQIDVTITGSNDVPVIVSEDLVGAIIEPVTPAGNLIDTGSITFSDRDLSDVHTVSATGTPIGSVLGTLSAVKDSDTTGSGIGGQLSWTYSVAASAVEYLAAGETLVESFMITLDDGNGGVLVKRIDVTISGSNDAVLITGEDLAGAITEPVTPSGNLSDTGSIGFSDVDLGDVHTVSAVGTPIGSVLGSLSAVLDSDTTGSGTGGALSWHYSVAASAVEYLAAGETRTDRFIITLGDGQGSTIVRQIDVTITGSNDEPVVQAEDLIGAITEPVTPAGELSDTGSLGFSDVDLGDVHIVSPVGTPIGSVLGSLSAVLDSDTTGSGTGGQLSWSYRVAASAVEYLAAGETKTDSFTITLDDGNGGVLVKRIDVTISGSNDAIVVSGEDLVGAIAEPVTPSGELSDTGSISFSDVDLGDVHTVSAAGTPIGAVLGSLSAVLDSDTTGAGIGGQLSWTYRVAASAVEYLAAGETKTDSFTITVDDGNGGVLVKRIDVTISGSNDAIVVTGEDLAGAITEPVMPSGELSDTGSIGFSDVDLGDAHTVSPVGTPIGAVLGSLSAVLDSDTTGSGTGGQLSWTYRVAASAVEYLAAGETKTDSFTITLDDGNGGVLVKRIDVTISGSNDAIVVTGEDLAGAIIEPVTPSGELSDTGSISFSDVDHADLHTVSAAGTPIGAVLGSLSAVLDSDTTGTGIGGQLSWTYRVAASAVEYLAAGESKTDSFTITLDDGNGGLLVKRIDVTISGSNDAIVVTGEDLVGAITEPVTPNGVLTDGGSIRFSDRDLSDVHTVSGTGTPIGSVLGSLSAILDGDTTGSGTGGQLSWSYRVAAEAVEHLAAGETLIERFRISLGDANGSLLTRQIDVTISGTNDAPVVVAERLEAVVHAEIGATGLLSDQGSIDFDDLDLSDVHRIVDAGTPIGPVLGVLEATLESDSTGSGAGGRLAWTYRVAKSAVENLAADQTRTERFSVAFADLAGARIEREITVVLSGPNLAPVIDGGDFAAAVPESAEPGAAIEASGRIGFSDINSIDAHRVSRSGVPVGAVLGSLEARIVNDSTGTGSGGTLAWHYRVDAQAVEYLGAGQTRVEQFDITLEDLHGGSVTRRIEVVLVGSNDAPQVHAEQLAAVLVEPVDAAGLLQADGWIDFSDRDADDRHRVIALAAAGGSVGSLAVEPVQTADGLRLVWRYEVATSAIDPLAAGETLSERFRILVDDAQGGQFERQVDISVIGRNDAPVVVAGRYEGLIEDGSSSAALLTEAGTVTFADVDRRDGHDLSVRPLAGTPTLGSLRIDARSAATGGVPGQVGWHYEIDAAVVQALNADDVRTDSFLLTIDDGQGGVAVRQIDIIIRGSNDAPTVSGLAPDRSIDARTEFSFSLPGIAFGDLDVDDELSYSARLADGRPLPDWLTFDAKRLIFSGVTPSGGGVGMIVEVTATDRYGATAVTRFGLQSLPSPTAPPELPPMPQPGADELLPARPAAAVPRAPLRPVFLSTDIAPALPTAFDFSSSLAGDDGAFTRAGQAAPVNEPSRRRELGSQADQVLAQALVVDSRTVQLSSVMASLNDSELQRKLEEIRRQLEEAAGDSDIAIASSIAMTTGLSVGYVVWLVRGGLLLSSVLSAMPAWQMIDPLPMLASGRGLAAAARDDEDDSEEVERLFGDRARDRSGPQVPADLPITGVMTSTPDSRGGQLPPGAIR